MGVLCSACPARAITAIARSDAEAAREILPGFIGDDHLGFSNAVEPDLADRPVLVSIEAKRRPSTWTRLAPDVMHLLRRHAPTPCATSG